MFVQLTMVTGSSSADQHDQDVEREGEDDGIVEVAAAPASAERTLPTIVNTDHVRNFYPRKRRSDGHQPVGTRITFSNGSGMAVTELFEEVAVKMGRTN